MAVDGVLTIVPTYNERDSIPLLVPRLFAEAPDADLLIVDDASPDGTADMAQERFGDDARLHVLRRTGLRGLGRSYVDGYLWALERGYGRVVQMDADLSHDPRYIAALVSVSHTFDVVLGSRYCQGGGVENWPQRRLALSVFANRYVAAVTRLGVADATSGFRCYTRQALAVMDVRSIASNGYAFQVEMTYRARLAGLSIAESPIVFTDRTHGHSKMSKRVIWESIWMPWKLRFGGGITLGPPK